MTMDHGISGRQPGDALYYEGAQCRRVTDPDEAFDREFRQNGIYVKPGETCWLEGDTEMLVTVVGSGIALTIFEEQQKFGVLSHFVLSPQLLEAFPQFDAMDPYHLEEVCAPIESAVREMKKKGAGRNRIRIRLFGGAKISCDPKDCGLKNYVFLKEYLERKKLRVMSEDTGGDVLRRIHFFPHTGAVSRFLLRRKSDVSDMSKQEYEYFSKLNK